MGDPDACAIGGVTLDILKKNGLEEAVCEKVVYTSSTVIELANSVKLGMIDAAIVWNATAALFRGETETVEIPLERNVIACIPIGILSFSKHKKEAKRFLKFITSQRAKEVFRRHGYTTEL